MICEGHFFAKSLGTGRDMGQKHPKRWSAASSNVSRGRQCGIDERLSGFSWEIGR